MLEKSELERIREEAEAKQRGILWPDMLRQGRSVDEFLWKGDPRATPIQRVGLALFGVLFSLCAILSVVLVFTQGEWAGRIGGVILGTITGIAGVRLLRNAFRRGSKRRKLR